MGTDMRTKQILAGRTFQLTRPYKVTKYALKMNTCLVDPLQMPS